MKDSRSGGHVDLAGKARHSMLLLYAAAALADCMPEDVQARALARYTFMYADDFLISARRWRVRLSHESATERPAHHAKVRLRVLDEALTNAGPIRDYLAAKRQPLASMRGDDIEATSLLWASVSHANVVAIGEAARSSFEELSGEDIVRVMQVDPAVFSAVKAALPARDPSNWYIAADTAADRRLYTLPAAQGGELGRIIAQINDVANHLDVLLRLAPVLFGILPFDWLVRSALITELDSLLNLTIGGRYVNKVVYPLIDLCLAGRSEAASEQLERVRGGIDPKGWEYIRLLRNKVGAHIDSRMTLFEIHSHLIELDYQGIVRLAEYLLDQLDALGATQLDLKLLLFGERRIDSCPVDSAAEIPGRPQVPMLPGSLAKLFRQINSPFMAATASSLGSAILAGKMSGRQPSPREKVEIPPRYNSLFEMPPLRYRDAGGSVRLSRGLRLGRAGWEPSC